MGKRRIHKGYVLKSEFCKEHGIAISEFNKVMQEKGYLVRTMVSSFFDGRKKFALSIGSIHISPLHGSNQQGTFQFNKKFLLDVFGIKQIDKPNVKNYSNYKLSFGKYKDTKLSEMNSDEQKNWIKWLHSEMTKKYDTETEKFKALDWFVKNLDKLN
jgi:hypothetical protein